MSEVSPYEVDLDWTDINEPEDIRAVVDLLGRATAKIHCASDEDSDQDLVDIQVEAAIVASLKGRRREFGDWLCQWGIDYAHAGPRGPLAVRGRLPRGPDGELA